MTEVVADTIVMPDTVMIAVTQTQADQIFGPRSILADGLSLTTEYLTHGEILTENIYFKLLVLLCFAGLCILTYFYRAQIVSLLNIFRGQLYVEKLLREQNHVFDKFVNLSIAIGLCSCGIALVKLLDIPYGGHLSEVLPQWGVDILAVALCLVCGIIFLFQTTMLKITGYLTYNSELTSGIAKTKRLVVAMGAIIITPIVLLFALSHYIGAYILLHILLIMAGGVFFFLLIRSYLLFLSQKISIMYWFLYLCAVEIFPVSLIVLLVMKNI